MAIGLDGAVLQLAPWYAQRPDTKAQALECFYKGRDWMIVNCNDPDCGRYTSFRDANAGDKVTLRYNKNLDSVYFTVEMGDENGN